MHRALSRSILVFAWTLVAVTSLAGQVIEVATRGPRFWAATSPSVAPVPLDIRQVPVLKQRVSLDLTDATLEQALAEITRQSGLRFMYSKNVLTIGNRVQLQAKRITVAAALTELLVDAGVDVVLTRSGQAMLVRQDPLHPAVVRGGTVTGLVTDEKSGQTLAGVEVLLEHTDWRTTTDTAGRYTLVEVDPGTYTLVARRFGYAKQSRSITVAPEMIDTVDMVLAPVVTRLNELVSTATGARRRMDIANDITTINADSLVRTQPITSVTDILETRVPGLTVQRTSGAPGDPARLRLRGAGSPLRSNDPIVIVDGIRVYAEQSAGRSANLASTIASYGGVDTNSVDNYAAPSPLDYIDPNTIETIEVVKGPSAATLYGPDAANGVIVITTKKGKAGPTRWSFSADHGQSRVPGSFPDLTLRWGRPTYLDNSSVPCGRDNKVGTPGGNGGVLACSEDSIVTYQLLNDPTLTVLDPASRNALMLGASGGTSALTYAVTGSYQRAIGLFKLPGYEVDRYESLHGGEVPPDWMQRPQRLTQWGVSSKLQARLGAKADVTLSAQFSRTAQQRSSLERQFGELLTTYFDRASGTYYSSNGGQRISGSTNAILGNYYQRATAGAVQFTNGLNLSWRPWSWFTVSGDAGLNVEQRDDEIFLPRNAGTISLAADTAGVLANGHGSSVLSTVNLRSTATVPLQLGLRLNLSAGVNYTGRSISDLALRTSDVPVGTSLLGNTVNGKSRSLQDNATFGWYLEQSINHRKFSLSTGLRLDGGSNYGAKVSSTGGGALPKLGFSYLVSDEPFFPFKDLFQSFRVRASYGRASRQPGPADQLRLYTSTSSDWVDGRLTDVVDLKNLGNTELRPERTTEFEGGLDADLLNRVQLTFTLYRKTTDDALMNFPLAPSLYGNRQSILRNIGTIRNTGIEATAQIQWLRSGMVTFGTDLLVSRNKSLVVKLGPGVDPFYVGSGAFNSQVRVVPGYPLYSRWTPPILGYTDANGDGALQASEVLFGDTAVYVGTSVPNYQADLHANLGFWRGAVTVSAGLHYDDGLTQFDEMSQALAPFSAAWNSATSTLAEQAASLYLGNSQYNWFQAVNVVRFQSLSVAYRVPPAFARRVGAQTLSLAVQGTNLGLWTNYRGLDPNVNAFATGNAVSDTGVLPEPRTWQVRINATY